MTPPVDIPAWLQFATVEPRRDRKPALERLTLKELSERIGRPLLLTEQLWGWSCALQGVEVAEGGVLWSTYGKGETPELAAFDYATALAGRNLVTNAYTPERREFGPFSTVAGAEP